jgi:hypothetical protein
MAYRLNVLKPVIPIMFYSPKLEGDMFNKIKFVTLFVVFGLSTAALAAGACSNCSCVKVKGTYVCACASCK